ncbi:MAG: NTP transferase domain-containing protein [Deltaproteobacteria bacterium]|jgi:NDP-sugar pyrophosphorylase family protein|nr:NTP transferase domain-containing protein [Deltaproteobacteria bacterium]
MSKKTIDTAMILAAGYGLRLMPLTQVRPKALLPVLNKPVLFRWLDALVELGVRNAVINTHHLAEQMDEAVVLARRTHPSLNIAVSFEPEILGTGGALKKAAPLLFPNKSSVGSMASVIGSYQRLLGSASASASPGSGTEAPKYPITKTWTEPPARPKSPVQAKTVVLEPGEADETEDFGPVLVVNADIYADLELERLCEAHFSRQGATAATLALVETNRAATVSLDGEGRIVAFRSPDPAPGEVRRLTGAGIMIIEGWAINAFPDGYSDSVEQLSAWLGGDAAPTGLFYDQAEWTDIGVDVPEYFKLNKTLAGGGIFAENMELIRGKVKGFLIAEDGAKVAESAEVDNCILLRGAEVGERVRLRNCVVAAPVPDDSVISKGVVI